MHTDWQHTVPCPQTLPHAPQLVESNPSSDSQPLSWLPSQLANPGRHESRTHTLFTHTDLALGILHCGQVQLCWTHTRPGAHFMPHPPQLLESLSMFCSQ